MEIESRPRAGSLSSSPAEGRVNQSNWFPVGPKARRGGAGGGGGGGGDGGGVGGEAEHIR